MSQSLSKYLAICAGACAMALSIPASAHGAGGAGGTVSSGSHTSGPVIVSKATHPGGTSIPSSGPRLDPPAGNDPSGSNNQAKPMDPSGHLITPNVPGRLPQ